MLDPVFFLRSVIKIHIGQIIGSSIQSFFEISGTQANVKTARVK